MNIYGEPAPRYRIMIGRQKAFFISEVKVPEPGDLFPKFNSRKPRRSNRQELTSPPRPEALIVESHVTG